MYKIIRSETIEELEELVNDALAEGFSLVGGPLVVSQNYSSLSVPISWYQALYKKPKGIGQ